MGMFWLGLAVGLVAAAIIGGVIANIRRNRRSFTVILKKHFSPVPLDHLLISERKFPYRVRADLQRALDKLFAEETTVIKFCGVHKEYCEVYGMNFSELIEESACQVSPTIPQYEEIDIGEDQPVRSLKTGFWLLEKDRCKFAVLFCPAVECAQIKGIQFHVATANDEMGKRITQEFFDHLEKSILKAECYRGKILSLEDEQSYSGESTGIKVHKLKTVEREQVILPAKTLELLDRNVIHFVRHRPRLAEFNQPTKKGILFYGKPGTGKTHMIHYLAKALEGHTTLLITAEQVGLLGEYMALARLLQPSVVVMEDVDLIARERTEMGSACEEVLLNKLLNEMDGLKEQADILFILTTNRPESLEYALSSRPGRVDQAIEFPLPDEEGREKLLRLYSKGVEISDAVAQKIVEKTENVSAAFIKELMRRSIQFHLEGANSKRIEMQDVENALEEMLFSGGSLNLKLLGAELDGRSRMGFGDK